MRQIGAVRNSRDVREQCAITRRSVRSSTEIQAGLSSVSLRQQIAFFQGDPADAVFYIQKGKIELKVVSQEGKEAIVAILGAGDFFGEGCLAGQPARMATAVAFTTSTMMRLDRSAIIWVLHY